MVSVSGAIAVLIGGRLSIVAEGLLDGLKNPRTEADFSLACVIHYPHL